MSHGDDLIEATRQYVVKMEIALYDTRRDLERASRDLETRPTAWAYQQACKALDHWRAEAKRLGEFRHG